jgi:hypothetical protein
MARNYNPEPPEDNFDAIAQFQGAMRQGPPWENITDFATHKSFCGMNLYPRQLTLLRLIYLETEMFTDYDLDRIEEWRQGFKDPTSPMGVQPDIWDRIKYLKDNGYHHFPQVQLPMGRRGSKGIVGGIVGAERMGYFYSLDNWQQHFGVDENSVGELTVIATTQGQAAKRLFADIRRRVERCGYLREHVIGSKYTEFYIRTPADERYIAQKAAEGAPLEREFASLYAVASAAVSTSQRGGAGFMNAYDEFAHVITGTGSTKTDTELYNAYQPSLDQFGIHKMTYIPSSPYSKIGQFYQLYKEGCVTMDEYNAREGRFERSTYSQDHFGGEDAVEEELDELATADPEMLIVQLPSWESYTDWDISHTIPMRRGRTRCFPAWKRPVQFPPTGDRPENKAMARMRMKNPEKFKVERGAQFASVEDAYLNEVMVDKIFERPWWRSDVTEQDRGKFSIVYRAHGDPSRTNANFGFAIAHVEDAPCDGCGWDPNVETRPGASSMQKYTHRCKVGGRVLPHVILDKLHVWKPQDYPDHTINYVTVGAHLSDFLRKWPSIKKMTYDQYAAFGLIDQQRLDFPHIRITEQTFTLQENQRRFERFKAAVNLGLVHSYKDTFFESGMSLLEQELKFLQEKNGKVEKQEVGPVTTKDLADAVMVVTVDLLEDHLERWYKGSVRASFGSTYAAGLQTGSEQTRMEMSGIGTRGAPMDSRAVRSAQNRENLRRFNNGRSERRERGYRMRDGSIAMGNEPFIPVGERANARNRRRDGFTPGRPRGAR